MKVKELDFALVEAAFADLPGWQSDDPRPLFAAMAAVLAHLRGAISGKNATKPYRTGALGLNAAELIPLLEKAERQEPQGPRAARQFFERNCQPFRIVPKSAKRGFVTAFYEPVLAVSPVRDSVWKYPLYRRPADLVDLDDTNRPAGMDAACAFGLLQDGSITPYPDRRTIDGGWLEGRGLEIAWACSKVDLFFVHVQGAARLRFADGAEKRVTYAAKSGHAFSPIGRLLIERGAIDAASVSMQTIRAWLEANPDEVDEVLWHNRSYIFFREAAVENAALGPIAAAKVPLVAGRSLAVDRLIHTFGFPFFVSAPTLTHLDDGAAFGRLMLALDTGSAIVGPARGDIFTGSGDAAGELAGTVRNAADFYILIPRGLAERFKG